MTIINNYAASAPSIASTTDVSLLGRVLLTGRGLVKVDGWVPAVPAILCHASLSPVEREQSLTVLLTSGLARSVRR